ncbi:FAD binding domain-containing protein [Streptomyces huiliensis]|uniref:FAD binding domain-containing protein n=1 Tax=Streptomyces huiliensis TaxID=2876027 RepID=UPI001CBF81D0|nr:xanthine dehydrogenase family protein subunit M [Streptomyces huiliensis]MBZ4320792.1 xanthine dehydrogenase family protein subunit M [Streptomyces huiliensis]
MREFRYHRAAATADAVALLAADPEARPLGGGTNLVDLMKTGAERPALLVDLRDLPLDRIETTADGGLRVGATVTNSDLAAHPEVRRRYPMLTQAVLAGASGQLRNMATVGGNLLQRTRCGYFTAGATEAAPCNKRAPGSGCAAVAGEHRNHAVLGASAHCVAVHPSDMAVALAALDAVVTYETADGPGELPLTAFYRPVGDTPHQETALPPGALVTGVVLPPAPPGASRYRKVRDRASYAFAIGSLAAALDVRDGVVREARLAFGAVASHPWRARRAEQALTGGPADAAAFAAAADAELAAARPLPHNGYKLPLLRDLVVDVLTALTEEAAA